MNRPLPSGPVTASPIRDPGLPLISFAMSASRPGEVRTGPARRASSHSATRRNRAVHDGPGEDCFRLWLDPAMNSSTGLAWRGERWLGADDAATLARGDEAFRSARPAATALRGSAHDHAGFERLWAFHLADRESGVRIGWADVGQIVLPRRV